MSPAREPPVEASSVARFRRMSVGVLCLYALLAALHRGEFWPFSIFPMFAKGGRSWTRLSVRDLGGDGVLPSSRALSREELPGSPLALAELDLDQNDLSKLVFASGPLDPVRLSLLERMFAPARAHRVLAVYAARGARSPTGAVRIAYTPIVVLGPKGARVVAESEP